MNEAFEFQLDRVRALKSLVETFPKFSPDGKSASDLSAMEDEAEAFYQNGFLTADIALTMALGTQAERIAALHTACVAVHPLMKSRYRTLQGPLRAINALPVKDESVAATLDRGKQMIALWKKLPLPPGQPEPIPPAESMFIPFPGMTLEAFEGIYSDALNAQDELPGLRAEFEKQEGRLHEWQDQLSDFTVNALIQGRAQFPSGVAREVLDRIPVAASTEKPGDASLERAELVEPNTVELLANAASATKFDFFHKAPGASEFTLIADDTPLSLLRVPSLAAGVHEFRVEGVNSRGNGPTSDVSQVTVS